MDLCCRHYFAVQAILIFFNPKKLFIETIKNYLLRRGYYLEATPADKSQKSL